MPSRVLRDLLTAFLATPCPSASGKHQLITTRFGETYCAHCGKMASRA